MVKEDNSYRDNDAGDNLSNSANPSGLFDRKAESSVIRSAVDELLNGHSVYLEIVGEPGVGKSHLKYNVLTEFSNLHVFKSSFKKQSELKPYHTLNHLFDQLLDFLEDLKSEGELYDFYAQVQSLVVNLTEDTIRSIPFIQRFHARVKKSGLVTTTPVASKNLVENFYVNFGKILFSEIDRKVVLLINNLQYYEEASLDLLFKIFNNISNPVMLLLSGNPGEWQDVGQQQIHNGGELQQVFKSLALDNFDMEQVGEFLAFCLDGEVERLKELAGIFYESTSGNPRNIIETKRRLIKDQNLYFDEQNRVWKWNVDTDLFKSKMSIVSMFLEKHDQLKKEERELLNFCACLGDNISGALIAKLTNLDLEETNERLRFLWREGYIDEDIVSTLQGNKNAGTYHFSSGDVAEVILDRMGAELRQQNHRKIANYFIKRSAVGIADRDIFEAATHLNKSRELTATEDERLEYISLNIRAAKKSRLLTSFKTGYEYISCGVDFAQQLAWESNRELLSQLYLEAYQLARLNDDMSAAREFYAIGLNKFDKEGLFDVMFVKMILDIQFGLLKEGLETGLQILNDLGFKVKRKASVVSVMLEFIKSRRLLRRRSLEEIYNLPTIEDNRLEKIFRVIFWLFRASQNLAPELNGVLALKQLQLTLKYGTNGESWSGLMAYGVIIGSGMNNYETAFDYADLGGKLALKYGNESGRVVFGKAIYWPFKHPLNETLEFFDLSKEKHFAEGDYIGAAEATINESLTHFSLGSNLEKVVARVQDNFNFCDKVSALDFRDFQSMLILNLNYLISGERAAEEQLKLEKIINETEYQMTRSVHLIFNLIMASLKEDIDNAELLIIEGRKAVDNLTGLYFKTEYNFFAGLTYLTKMRLSGNNYSLNRKADRLIAVFEKWSNSAPSNYRHKLCLLRGMQKMVNGAFKEGEAELKEALQLASEQNNHMIKRIVLKELLRCAEIQSDEQKSEKYKRSFDETSEAWGVRWK